jgi:hypothetical protein
VKEKAFRDGENPLRLRNSYGSNKGRRDGYRFATLLDGFKVPLERRAHKRNCSKNNSRS